MTETEPSRAPERSESGLSSHWRQHFQHATWKSDELGLRHGLGLFIPYTVRRAVTHYLLQIPFRRQGRRFQAFRSILDAGRRFAKIQGRVFDLDELRQVLALSCVRHHIDLQPSARFTFAVIGDGYGRLANLLLATFPKCTVVLVNLPPALRIDLASLKLGWPDLPVLEAVGPADLEALASAPHVRIVAIPADRADLLRSIPLDGAFNVSSMQEMDLSVIANYFRLLRANPAPDTWFYCSNVVAKFWTDGTVVRFADYPWDPEDDILLDEPCPWVQKGYVTFPPRYFVRAQPGHHRLVRLRKRSAD